MKKHLLAPLCAAFLFASCTKDSSAPPPTIIGKWQLDNYSLKYFRGGVIDTLITVTRDSLASCARDDYWQYNDDNTGLAYYGTLCAGENKVADSFSWELTDNVLVLTYPNGRKEGMTIAVASNDYYTSLDTLYPSSSQPDTGTLMQQFKRIP